jgi:hypothetical protein
MFSGCAFAVPLYPGYGRLHPSYFGRERRSVLDHLLRLEILRSKSIVERPTFTATVFKLMHQNDSQ